MSLRFAPQTLKAQAELQAQKEQVTRFRDDMLVLQRRHDDKSSQLSSFLGKYEDKNTELEEVKMQLQAERHSNR